MDLKYITRGNTTPQGKSRVYFTGYPSDYKLFFMDIAQELLQQQNCAIYYDQEPESSYDYDELSFNLGQMQLFVIPVTTKFLTQPSRARDVEFAFAIDAHIPVLPLTQEDGIEELFNMVCGNLQMLNKDKHDPTSIPYEEKLAKFLDSVLVGDELAEQIRKAFDAYIFLSYRQKDRKYAQELMRLIHKNDFCRDIAIWYDEFLMPGEDFNQFIQAALEKSDLFALTITPNIVNESNYVMTTEYPMAQKCGKAILSAEIVPTDWELLQNNFCGIPPCTNVHDEIALSQALHEALRGIELQHRTDNPEHNFFIGLAYLNGIDMEVDRDRALSLIINAANCGLDVAIEKLVGMYRNGDGVERNYYTAIRWQKELVKIHQKRYKESSTESNKVTWVSALCDLGAYCYEVRDFPSAKGAFAKMSQLSEELIAEHGSGAAVYLCMSYERLGDISVEEGKLVQAEDYYLRSLKINSQLAEKSQLSEAKLFFAISSIKVGDILKSKGNLTQAKKYYFQAMELYKQLVTGVKTEEARRDLAIAYERLGNIDLLEGKFTEAKDCYLKSLDLRKQLMEELKTVDAKRNLAVGYEKIGDVSWAKEGPIQAKGYYLQCMELREELLVESQTIQARSDLAIIYHRLGGISQSEGNLAQAKEFNVQSLNLRMQLAIECPTVEIKDYLLISYISLGDFSRAEGNLAQAKEYYLQSLELSQQLAEDTRTIQSRKQLAISYERLGGISWDEGNLAQAKEYYLQSLHLIRQLAIEDQTPQNKKDLLLIYDYLYDISRVESNLVQAKEYCLQSLELSQQMVAEFQPIDYKMNLVDRYSYLGDISMAENDTAQAKVYYLQSLELLQQLVKETENAEVKRYLAIIYERLGDISQGEDEQSIVKEYYLQSLKWNKQWAEVTDTSQSNEALTALYAKYYSLTTASNKKKRRSFLTFIDDIWKKLIQ